MPPQGDRADGALSIERAIRAAARAGNRLLSGNRARVAVTSPVLRELLLVALSRMGVRIVTDRHVADFEFVDSLAGDIEEVRESQRSEHRGVALPLTVVALDGAVHSGRASDAASKIAWAAQGMPTTVRLAKDLRSGAATDGEDTPRIAGSRVLEPKTAAFAIALADAGCDVAVFSAVSETDPEVARALAADSRVAVFAPTEVVTTPSAEAVRRDAEHARGVLGWGADYLIDDGSHLIRLAHTEYREALGVPRGAAEETTSGVRPLREMNAEQALSIPVIAVNDARTKTDFDNLIGTGQSCVFAIADVLDDADGTAYSGVRGSRWTVLGYGPVGVGVARFAAALGAEVTVVERDEVRALSALHDGFEARRSAEALESADVVVSATGVWHTIGLDALARMRPGAVVAVAGGIDDEIALDDATAAGWSHTETHAHVDEWRAPGADHGVRVLAAGGGVNYSAAEGNPIEVMDLSFATQLAALSRLMREDLPAGVHTILPEDERLVAAAALAARAGSTDPAPAAARPGGAAQPWRVHRYSGRR